MSPTAVRISARQLATWRLLAINCLTGVRHRAIPFVSSAVKIYATNTATVAPTGLLCFVLSALISCTDPNKPNLEVACALMKCICLSNSDGYFARNFKRQTTTTVLWTDRGNAYCPEDFSLRQVDEKKKQYYTPHRPHGT